MVRNVYGVDVPVPEVTEGADSEGSDVPGCVLCSKDWCGHRTGVSGVWGSNRRMSGPQLLM